MTRRYYTAASVLAIAAVYFCAAKYGLSLAVVNASSSAVWPPTGIALAVLLLWGYRLWPGIFLGAFLVNITTQGTLATTLGIASGNTLEALLGAWLVQRFANGVKAFERAGDIFRFIFLAAIVSTGVSATFGVTSLCLGGFASWEQYSVVWSTWWLGDMVGALTVAPLLVIWMTPPFLRLNPKQLLEAGGLLLMVFFVGQFVFLGKNPFDDRNAPLEYFALLPLLWAAFRFGQRGAVTMAFLTSGIALWGALHGFGPFVRIIPNETLLFLQAFIGTITATSLVLAAVISERQQAEQRLRSQEAVSRVLAIAPTLIEAAPKILQALCEVAGWEVGAIWSVNRKTDEMSFVEFWHVPSVTVPEFEAVTRQRTFAPGIGLPGRTWKSGKPEWISDLAKDLNFPRAPMAIKDGLRTGFCFPIKLGDEVLGVIECFSRQLREPDEYFLQVLADIGSELGQFIERKRAEAALRQAKDELAEANEWLEKRVRERTVDLIQTNTALEAEIVARKKAELVHAQLAAIVESSSDAILSKTLEGIITSWNKGAEKMFGYTTEEIVGRPVSTLLPAELTDELGLVLDRIQREEAVEPFETVRVRKDGRVVHVSLTLSPIKDEAGCVTGVSAIMQDISERKRLEAEILQVSEYEQRRIAEDLHDGVGQQLGGISFLSDVLKKNLAEQASTEAEAAAKISKLLIVAMAQTRSLARGLHPVPPETNGLMSALEDLATRMADLFKVSCHFECPQPVLIEDNIVATHLYRIAQEATTNAIKHGQAQRIEIRLSSAPERIILAVSDDGVGFKVGTRHQKGMGLRIMNHRAGMIGAAVVVQKKRGGGTEAVCTVQINKSKGQAPKN